VQPMGREINLNGLAPVFRGSDAVRAGVLSRNQLRGPAVRRLFQGVYSPAGVAETHELYCTGAGLVLPPSAVVTGRSAATLRGVALARTEDLVEALVPWEARVVRGSRLAVRRTVVRPTSGSRSPACVSRRRSGWRWTSCSIVHYLTRSPISMRCSAPGW